MGREKEGTGVDLFGPKFRHKARYQRLVVIVSQKGEGEEIGLTCFVTNFVTDQLRIKKIRNQIGSESDRFGIRYVQNQTCSESDRFGI